jgi:hypothetical protein
VRGEQSRRQGAARAAGPGARGGGQAAARIANARITAPFDRPRRPVGPARPRGRGAPPPTRARPGAQWGAHGARRARKFRKDRARRTTAPAAGKPPRRGARTPPPRRCRRRSTRPRAAGRERGAVLLVRVAGLGPTGLAQVPRESASPLGGPACCGESKEGVPCRRRLAALDAAVRASARSRRATVRRRRGAPWATRRQRPGRAATPVHARACSGSPSGPGAAGGTSGPAPAPVRS